MVYGLILMVSNDLFTNNSFLLVYGLRVITYGFCGLFLTVNIVYMLMVTIHWKK